MKEGIKRFDVWYLKTDLLGKPDGRAEEGLDLKRSSSGKVLIHEAVTLR